MSRRYVRHLLIPQIGIEGQRKIGGARVLCVGVGGLGSPAALYLAAAGIGRIGLVDNDVVDVSNLQRQIGYTENDVGRLKVDVLGDRLGSLNSSVAVDRYPVRFEASIARDLVRPYDVVIDGTDNYRARYLVNDACVLERRPNVFASLYQFDAQITVFSGTGNPCYRCVFPASPVRGTVPSCSDGGVLGALAGTVGSWQATEALKLIVGVGATLHGMLLSINALDSSVEHFELEGDPQCPLCGAEPSIRDVSPIEGYETESATGIGPERLDELLEEGGDLTVLDVREAHEYALGEVPNSTRIPASVLLSNLSQLDTRRSYVVCCRVGRVSQWAVETLRSAGFTRVTHLDGGVAGYVAHALLLF